MNRRIFMKVAVAAGVVTTQSSQSALAEVTRTPRESKEPTKESEITRTPRGEPTEESTVPMELPDGFGGSMLAMGQRGWSTEDRRSGLGTTLAMYLTNEAAKSFFKKHLTNPQETVEVSGTSFERIVLSQEIPNFGDESIAFRITTGNGRKGNYVVVRVENLVYIFSSFVALDVLLNFENSIIKDVTRRSNPSNELSMIEIMESLPILQEVEAFDMTTMYHETYSAN